MGALRDITSQYNSYHNSSCPCGKNVNDFMDGYCPKDFHTDSVEDILLVSNIPLSHKDYLLIVKKHFLILAQRYHPDKNSAELNEICNKTMSTLNQAYCTVEAKYHKQQRDKTTAVKDGKVYSYPAKEVITCQHYMSFAVYCHPDYLNNWRALIEEEWGTVTKTTDKSVQYGDSNKSLYITVYSNGTVFVQGNLAISYSLENMWRLILKLKTPQNMKANKRSQAFKEAIKLFGDTKFQPPKILALSDKPDVSHLSIVSQYEETLITGIDTQSQNKRGMKHSSNSPPHTPSIPADGLGASGEHRLMSMLTLAMAKIADLKQKIEQIQQESTRFQHDTKSEIAALQKENKQLRTTLGPKISLMLQGQQNTENQRTTDSMSQNQNTGQQDGTSTNSRTAEEDWREVKHRKSSRRNTNDQPSEAPRVERPWQIKFESAKTVMIEKITNPTDFASDDKVRRELGKNFDRVIIDRITRYSHNPKKLMVQFASVTMKEEVISKWTERDMFGSSTIRDVTNRKKNLVGVAKGVPLDMSDEELKSDIHTTYPDITFTRMTKGPEKKKLRAVKIFFHSEEQLEKAVRDGLKLESQSQYVRVEELKWTPRVRQCTNCWRLGHSATECQSQKSCPHCSENTEDGSHQLCIDNPKCRNCNGPHSASQTIQCSAYQKRLAAIIRKHKELNDDS